MSQIYVMNIHLWSAMWTEEVMTSFVLLQLVRPHTLHPEFNNTEGGFGQSKQPELTKPLLLQPYHLRPVRSHAPHSYK